MQNLAAAVFLLLFAGGRAVSAQQVPDHAHPAEISSGLPAPDNRPLPDIPTLLRDINKNQRMLEDIRKLYTCRLSEKEDKLDSNGQVKTSTVKDYDLFFVGDDEVRHLLAKDGKPLDAGEQKKEDERFDKEFDKAKKKQAELANNPKKEAKKEEEEDAELSDFLRAERFTNPRRELFHGKEVIAFDFSGEPDYKPKKTIERIIQKLKGVMWVDEQAREIVRLEARFDESAKVGGGLVAAVHKGSNFVFEQEKINEEIWMPTYVEVHLDARVFVFKMKENAVDRYSDYKKFRVGTSVGPSVPAPESTADPDRKPPSN
ncbi:MAG: hypothetical protein WB780_24425 [Candidatus Acidiferrales bacterium]